MKKSRNFDHAMVATLLTAAVVAAVILVNVITTAVIDRFPLSVDLTKNQVYEISKESVDYIKKLDKDITITVLAEENTYALGNGYYTQIYNVMKKYPQNSKHIKLEFKPLLKNPDISKKYADESLTEGSIIVSRNDNEDRYKIISTSDLVEATPNYETMQYDYEGSNAEQELTRALVAVSDDNPSKVGLITGHNELGSEGLASLLSDNTYEAQSISLITGQIPDDLDILVIDAPTSDFTEDEIKALNTFLENDGNYGKSIVYAAAFNQGEMPNLHGYLADWGIQVDSGMLIETDTSQIYFNDPTILIGAAKSSDHLANMKNQSKPVLVPYSTSLTQLFSEKEYYTTEILLASNETVALSPVEEISSFDPNNADTALRTLGIGASLKPANVDKASKIIALSTPMLYDSTMLAQASASNAEFCTSIFNNLAGKGEAIQFTPQKVGGEKLGIDESSSKIMLAVFVIIIPIGLLVAGLVVWLRRRNK